MLLEFGPNSSACPARLCLTWGGGKVGILGPCEISPASDAAGHHRTQGLYLKPSRGLDSMKQSHVTLGRELMKAKLSERIRAGFRSCGKYRPTHVASGGCLSQRSITFYRPENRGSVRFPHCTDVWFWDSGCKGKGDFVLLFVLLFYFVFQRQ